MFTFKTNLEAPRYKLINIDFNNYKMVSMSNKIKFLDIMDKDESLKADNYIASFSNLCSTLF